MSTKEYHTYQTVVLTKISTPYHLMHGGQLGEVVPYLPLTCTIQHRSLDFPELWLLEARHPSIRKYNWIRVPETDFCSMEDFHNDQRAKKAMPKFRLIRGRVNTC